MFDPRRQQPRGTGYYPDEAPLQQLPPAESSTYYGEGGYYTPEQERYDAPPAGAQSRMPAWQQEPQQPSGLYGARFVQQRYGLQAMRCNFLWQDLIQIVITVAQGLHGGVYVAGADWQVPDT